MKPKIILSCSQDQENYIREVIAAGGEPHAGCSPSWDEGADGLILCGGCDVSPARYGEEKNGSEIVDEARDAAEWELCRRALEAGKPIFGICRGVQVLNVYFGGSLIQHLPTVDLHRKKEGAKHGTLVLPTSRLFSLYGAQITVNSYHHQAVKQYGAGFHGTQFCAEDGSVEAIEHESLPVFGVQWHPERTAVDGTPAEGARLFAAFVSMCQNAR